MTGRKSSPELPRTIENLLSSFPIPECDWEANRSSIQARIQSGGIEFDAALLDAPLPAEIGEESRTSGISPNAKAQSLADLARASVAKKRDKQDSADIAKESFSIATQARSQTHEIADRLRKAREPSQPGAAAMPAQQTAPELEQPAAPPPPVHVAKQQSSQRGIWLGAGATALALAAAVAIWLRGGSEVATESVAKESPAVASIAPPAPATAPTVAEQVSDAPRGKDVSELPQLEEPRAGTAASEPRPGVPKTTTASRPSAVGQNPQARAKPAPNLKENSPEPAMSPALGAAGGIPQKPSTGAVQAALGAVMSGARGCVAGHDQPSSAEVVFGSDGKVQNVAVSGPAAGTPAASCIEARLKKARVQPFAADSFSVRATIRPE